MESCEQKEKGEERKGKKERKKDRGVKTFHSLRVTSPLHTSTTALECGHLPLQVRPLNYYFQRWANWLTRVIICEMHKSHTHIALSAYSDHAERTKRISRTKTCNSRVRHSNSISHVSAPKGPARCLVTKHMISNTRDVRHDCQAQYLKSHNW